MSVAVAGQGMTIRWMLASVMLEKDIKTGKLSEVTGLHPSSISRLKSQREMPARLDRETLEKLCKALDCQPGELLRYLPDEVKE